MRRLAQDRQVLVDDLDLAVGAGDGLHRLVRALAVGALIVVELDHYDITRGIAADRAVGVGEQGGVVLADRLLGDGVALRVLLALQLLHGLDQHFGIGEQIGPDALAQVGRHAGSVRRGRGR